MLGRGRWFFLQISRRRRIGKARLVQELLQDHADSVKPGIGSQVAGHLETLAEKWELVVQWLSVFAMPKARKGHYTIRDNFLRCWLDALAVPTAAINSCPLERLVGQFYEERSRLGLGDFPLTSRIEGWWDRSDTEIDLVALDETAQRLRLSSCKRSAAALVADLGRFDGHAARFLNAFPCFSQ